MELRINENATLQKSTPYMLRNDGKLLGCGVAHPYIRYNLYDDVEKCLNNLINNTTNKIDNNLDSLVWFYKNTSYEETKNDIVGLASLLYYVNPINAPQDKLDILKELFPIHETLGNMGDCVGFIGKINAECNQEFCRVRTSNMLWGGNNNSIYFRISSINFNWFNLIWKICYDNKNFISDVTIVKDSQSLGGRRDFYSHNGIQLDNLDIDEFLMLSGNPIIESNQKQLPFYSRDTFSKVIGEWHPLHSYRIYAQLVEEYSNTLTL